MGMMGRVGRDMHRMCIFVGAQLPQFVTVLHAYLVGMIVGSNIRKQLKTCNLFS